jgi:hypothetical protein
MLIGKLSSGVLRVLTPLGTRYIKPTFSQRLHLLWIFRNFQLLPLQVLSLRQQHLIDELCAEQHFISASQDSEMEGAPILGTVERRPPVEVEPLPERRPNGRVADPPIASGLRQRS